MTPADFRVLLPEFGDTTKYPDAMVQAWMTVAVSMVNSTRWGELTDLGVSLVTAHHLALGARDTQLSTAGGIPGQSSAPMSSKAVDKVSASYDTGAVTIQDAGFWNMTSYGIRFISLARMMGAGGMHL